MPVCRVKWRELRVSRSQAACYLTPTPTVSSLAVPFKGDDKQFMCDKEARQRRGVVATSLGPQEGCSHRPDGDPEQGER